MGAAGTGEYNILDEQNTMSYATAEEKSAANWESFFARLEEQGFWGYINLLFQKLRLTFGDAGAGYRGELGVSDAYNDLNMYLVGGKADFVGYAIQLQYVFSLFCIIYIVIKMLLDKKKCLDFEIVFWWNIAGAFVFHMLWEAGNIYSLSFALLFPCSIVFVEGLNIQEIGLCKLRKPLFMCGSVSGVIIMATIVSMIKLYPMMTNQSYETNDGVVNQYIYHWGENDELQFGETVVQSFWGNREFNRIAFQVRNLWGQENDGVYHIQLLDEQQECLQEYEIYARNYGDYDFVRLETNVTSELNEKYYLRIAKVSGSETNGLVFLSYHTGNYDAYSYGEVQNGEKFQDLCFSLYMTKNAPYCKKWVFGFGAFTIIFVEIAIFILYYLMCIRGWKPRKNE